MTKVIVLDSNVDVDVVDDMPHRAGEIIAVPNFLLRKLNRLGVVRKVLIQDLDDFNDRQGLTPSRGRGRNPDNS